MVEELYINKAEIVADTFEELSVTVVDDLEKIINRLIKGEITSCVLYSEEKEVSINIFSEGGNFNIGIVDEEEGINYYYTDGTNNTNLVEIDGNYFEANMVCYSSEILNSIIVEFAKTGKLSTTVKWLQEEQ